MGSTPKPVNMNSSHNNQLSQPTYHLQSPPVAIARIGPHSCTFVTHSNVMLLTAKSPTAKAKRPPRAETELRPLLMSPILRLRQIGRDAREKRCTGPLSHIRAPRQAINPATPLQASNARRHAIKPRLAAAPGRTPEQSAQPKLTASAPSPTQQSEQTAGETARNLTPCMVAARRRPAAQARAIPAAGQLGQALEPGNYRRKVVLACIRTLFINGIARPCAHCTRFAPGAPHLGAQNRHIGRAQVPLPRGSMLGSAGVPFRPPITRGGMWSRRPADLWW